MNYNQGSSKSSKRKIRKTVEKNSTGRKTDSFEKRYFLHGSVLKNSIMEKSNGFAEKEPSTPEDKFEKLKKLQTATLYTGNRFTSYSLPPHLLASNGIQMTLTLRPCMTQAFLGQRIFTVRIYS